MINRCGWRKYAGVAATTVILNSPRGAVDATRGRPGRFIVLGSAQPALVRGVSESLAGRAAVIELDPLTAHEAEQRPDAVPWSQVWLKGGFPDALRGDSRAWWESYLRLVLERDLPQYGVRADPLFMRRLLTMLAHQHGGLLNASALGGSLGVSHHTLLRHLDVLEAIYLLRRLPPYFRNVGKRLTKAPKVSRSICAIRACCPTCSTSRRRTSWLPIRRGVRVGRASSSKMCCAASGCCTRARKPSSGAPPRVPRSTSCSIGAASGLRWRSKPVAATTRAVRVLREAMPDVDAARG
jgi:hypothetical protein